MTRKSKREIERAVDEIADTAPTSRTELVADLAMWYAEEPDFTEYLASRGFVVEREVRTHDTGHEDVVLHTTPSAFDVFNSITWHRDGPTTPNDAVRVRFDEERREDALATAEYPIKHERPDLPEDPITVVDGDGWEVVAEADLVAENKVMRRSKAEREGLEILGDAPPVADRERYDLVEVDAPPAPYGEYTPSV